MKTRIDLPTLALLLVAHGTGLAQPLIITQPQSVTNLAGTTASFSVTASSPTPLAYQWLFNSTTPLGQATNADLMLTNVQSANAGGYSVIVSNVEGAVTSLVATLTILTRPSITRQPANQTASLFADATFFVRVAGDLPLSYQWRFNDGDLVGLTNASLTVTNVARTNAGNYSVVVANLSGSVTSQVASLTIVPFNAMYEFGFSWTQTADADCGGPTMCPKCYWQGRYSNGPMWPEFLSTNLGLAYVAANNYAHCGAGGAEVLDQSRSYLAPRHPPVALYCLMFSDDILWAWPGVPGYVNVTNETRWAQIIRTGVSQNSNAVAQLYARGARTIVAQSELDLSSSPSALRTFGTDGAALAKVSEYCTLYNAGFSNAVNAFGQTKPDLRIIWVDLFSRLNDVLANPAQYGFTKTTTDALDDTSLIDKSFTGPGADYVFWNDLHPTSKFHELITAWTLEALANSVLETLEISTTGGSPAVQMNHLQIGRDYTLQSRTDLTDLTRWHDVQSFTAAAGTNQWTVTPDGTAASFYQLKWQP